MKGVGLIVLVLLGLVVPATAYAQATMETVRNRGYVLCGVADRIPGFSNQDANGVWKGFDIDFCRALAAAVLNNGNAFKAEVLGLDALAAGEIDVLHAGTSWTFGRDTRDHFEFPTIYFYDGLGFFAHTHDGLRTLSDAFRQSGLSVCVLSTTSNAQVILQDYIARTKLKWRIVPVLTLDGMWRAFFGGRCDMVLYNRTALTTVQAGRMGGSTDFVVFPEVISTELLAPVVREDDARWRDLVSWVTLVTIIAEKYGITQSNVDTMKATSKSHEVRRLLGVEKGLAPGLDQGLDQGLGQGFGLDDQWAYRVIKSVGNYGEIFRRNLGADSPFKIPRGRNNLLRNGGLLSVPPLF